MSLSPPGRGEEGNCERDASLDALRHRPGIGADRDHEKQRQQQPPDERTAAQPFFQGGCEHHAKSDAQQNDADQPSDRQRGGRGGIHARVSHGWREGGRTRMAALTRRNRAWGISSLTPRIKLKARRHQCVGDG
jgi:hypothetical protein